MNLAVHSAFLRLSSTKEKNVLILSLLSCLLGYTQDSYEQIVMKSI